jgi:hypothetical protein
LSASSGFEGEPPKTVAGTHALNNPSINTNNKIAFFIFSPDVPCGTKSYFAKEKESYTAIFHSSGVH